MGNIKTKKLFTFTMCTAMAFAAVIGVCMSSNTLMAKSSSAAGPWRHYAATGATYNSHGLKEYWTDCAGNTVLEDPQVSATDYGPQTREFINSLDSDDERLLPTLYEGCSVVMDADDDMFFVGPHDTGYRGVSSWTTSTDDTYGKVYDITLQESGNLQIYFKNRLNSNVLTKYSEIFFYIYNANPSSDMAFCLDFNWSPQATFACTPQNWVKVSYNVDILTDIYSRPVWVESWNNIYSTTGWKITPIYGVDVQGVDLLKNGNLIGAWDYDYNDYSEQYGYSRRYLNYSERTSTGSFVINSDWKLFSSVAFYTSVDISGFDTIEFTVKPSITEWGKFHLFNTVANYGELIVYEAESRQIKMSDSGYVTITIPMSEFDGKEGQSNWFLDHNGGAFDHTGLVGFGYNGGDNNLEIISVSVY